MLRRAIDRCVSFERLVRALNVDLSSINWLQDKQFTLDVTRILRNMTSARQVKAVELMVNSNTITGEQRFRPAQPDGGGGLHSEVAV
jgi:hypothetical protein